MISIDFRRDSRPTHADDIDRVDHRVVGPRREHERRNVVGNAAAAADERQHADRRKVVHDDISGNDRAVVHVDVSAQAGTPLTRITRF